jgi:hypothetical protein
MVIKLRIMRWEGNVASMWEINACIILVRKPEGKKQLARHTHRWEDNIRMNPREIGWQSTDWMHLAQDWDQ